MLCHAEMLLHLLLLSPACSDQDVHAQPAQVSAPKSLHRLYRNHHPPMLWIHYLPILIYFHSLVGCFFFLKIYHTATGKGVWPLQAFFSQAALCPLLTFPIRRGLSQKGAWPEGVLEGVPSWTPVFSQVLVEKPAPASVQWLLAGIQNWNAPCFCKWQKVGGQLEEYLFLACPHT